MNGKSQGVSAITSSRGISEVLHFTMHLGLTGILDARYVKSRRRLEMDGRLQYIFFPNAEYRKDTLWLDHVNLSISEINSSFFKASGHWFKNEGKWWVILSFDPVILEHQGVVFTTTNNIYSGVRRGEGHEGLSAMFADTICQWHGKMVQRSANLPAHLTTCEQAEVLYPTQISTDLLRKIYVQNGEDADDTMAQLATLGHNSIEVVIAPDRFMGRLM